MNGALRLITDDFAESLQTAYAIRTDNDGLPVIEKFEYYPFQDEYKRQKYKILHPMKYENKFYPYDHLYSRKEFGHATISECYSKGWVFHTESDALKRIELFIDKKRLLMEQKMDEVASFSARFDKLKSEINT